MCLRHQLNILDVFCEHLTLHLCMGETSRIWYGYQTIYTRHESCVCGIIDTGIKLYIMNDASWMMCIQSCVIRVSNYVSWMMCASWMMCVSNHVCIQSCVCPTMCLSTSYLPASYLPCTFPAHFLHISKSTALSLPINTSTAPSIPPHYLYQWVAECVGTTYTTYTTALSIPTNTYIYVSFLHESPSYMNHPLRSARSVCMSHPARSARSLYMGHPLQSVRPARVYESRTMYTGLKYMYHNTSATTRLLWILSELRTW